MSSEPFTCEYCQKVCVSHKGLKLHQSKSHKDVINTLQCEYCHDVMSSNTALRMHLTTCKVKTLAEEAEKKRMCAENQALKQELKIKQQEIEKLHETIQKLNTVNINNFSGSFSSTVNFQTETMKEISVDYLQECFEKIKKTGVISNATEMAVRMFSTDLQYRIVKTDNARQVIQWNDGDEKRKIKDPQGRFLAIKTLNATQQQLCNLNEEYNAQIDEYFQQKDSAGIQVLADAIKFTYKASHADEDVVEEFGKKIGKMGSVNPSLLPPQKTNCLLERSKPFVDEIVSCLLSNPQMLFVPPEHLGTYLSIRLEKYRRACTSFQIDEKDDDKLRVILRFQGMDITKGWFFKCFREALKEICNRLEQVVKPFIRSTNIAHYYESDDIEPAMRDHLASLKLIIESEDTISNDYFTTLMKSM